MSPHAYILSLVDFTSKSPLSSIILRKSLDAALPSAVLMPSLMTTTPTFCFVSSASTVGLRRGKPAFAEALEYATERFIT